MGRTSSIRSRWQRKSLLRSKKSVRASYCQQRARSLNTHVETLANVSTLVYRIHSSRVRKNLNDSKRLQIHVTIAWWICLTIVTASVSNDTCERNEETQECS